MRAFYINELPSTAVRTALVAQELAGVLRDFESQARFAAAMDGHEGYLEHEWAAKTLQRLEAIPNAASPEHKAAGKVLKELAEHHRDGLYLQLESCCFERIPTHTCRKRRLLTRQVKRRVRQWLGARIHCVG